MVKFMLLLDICYLDNDIMFLYIKFGRKKKWIILFLNKE